MDLLVPAGSAPLAATLAVEVERQWCASRSPRLPDRLGRFELAGRRIEDHVDRYYDTAALCLGAHRARLRVRTEVDASMVTLKRRLADGGRARRKLELHARTTGDPYDSAPFLAARLIADRPVRVIGELHTRRTTFEYRAGSAIVEVVRDRVVYPWGETIWRVEAEGEPVAVEALAAELERRVGVLGPVRRGKAARLFDGLGHAA